MPLKPKIRVPKMAQALRIQIVLSKKEGARMFGHWFVIASRKMQEF